MLQTGLKKELEKFDRERILVAWDGLISRQQAVLAHHGVPTMFGSSDGADREVANTALAISHTDVYVAATAAGDACAGGNFVTRGGQICKIKGITQGPKNREYFNVCARLDWQDDRALLIVDPEQDRRP